ncbi:MAG TPA: hypothetical protein ENJ37_10850 [Deltaproteobacteria bacterium]|nr:hypothetical protein [Deltaproteobacteria bacterium]
MQKIPISLAGAGMVLARDVFRGGSGGIPVCGRGTVLTDELIGRLRSMGIEAVVVEGRPVKGEEGETLEEVLASLDRRFSRVESDRTMMAVKEIYKRYYRRVFR